MLTRNLLVIFLLLIGNQAFGFDHQFVAEQAAMRLDQGDTHGLATEAFTNMFKFAAGELERRGKHNMAERLLHEWESSYSYYVAGMLGDVGDHQPVSAWISLWYAALSAELGDDFMEKSHLKDIWVLNLTLKVVFDPNQEAEWCGEQMHKYPADTCQAEYRRHFAGTKYVSNDPYATDQYLHHGFAGVVTYWLVWGACEFATSGTGWFLICTPAGTLAEVMIEKKVAPKASDRLWDRSNMHLTHDEAATEQWPMAISPDVEQDQ